MEIARKFKVIDMHPLINEIINTEEPFADLLQKYSHENNPLLVGVKTLFDAHSGFQKDSENALKLAAKVDLIDADPDLAILFLYIWGFYSKGAGRTVEFAFIKKIAFSLVNEKTPLILKEFLETLEIDEDKFDSHEDLMFYKERLILNSQDKTLGQKRRLYTNERDVAINGCMNVMSEECKKVLSENEIIYKTFNFINAIEVCDVKNASLLLPYMQECNLKKQNKYLLPDAFEEYEIILQLLIAKENLNEKIIIDSTCNNFWKKEMLANLYLFRRQEKKALHELEGNWTRNVRSNFIHVTHFRLLLIERNIKGALEKLSKNTGYKYRYFQDILWARLELLRGDKEKAIMYFAKALHSADKYNAKLRLQMELNLALELSAGDLLFLSTEATKISKEEIQSFQVSAPKKLLPEKKGIGNIVGKSNVIKNLKNTITKYASLEVPVLIIGETGVGKEVTAKALFEESNRKNEPYLTINCGAIGDSLLQSELFGHVAGSFTGATKKHDGLFLSAGKGTIFLDELGETSTKLQVALLRVLESGEIQPVGSTKTIPIHCRVFAGTNASLEEMVQAGTFRKDLYFRIKRLTLEIPPLREHPEDIVELAKNFMIPFLTKGKSPQFSDELKEAFLKYTWPGNIRELKNEMERIQFLNSEKEIYSLEDSELLFNFMKPKVKDNQPAVTEAIKTESSQVMEVEKPKNMRSFSKLPAWRRQNAIVEELIKHQRLTRAEIASMFEVSRETASLDLRKLVEENRIKMVAPTPSSRTNYFVALSPEQK